MRKAAGYLVLTVALGAATAQAQYKRTEPNYEQVYCSGQVTKESVPHDTYVISGEESHYKNTFALGDYIYINKGGTSGVKVGDEFLVSRPVKDPARIQWFKWQNSLARAMGRQWADIARLKVVVIHPEVSIAQITHQCDFLWRGDYVLPFAERAAPKFKPGHFDRFQPVSGRPQAMVVNAKAYVRQVGTGDVIYVNLGTRDGVKMGDYFTVFRYQGTHNETVYQVRHGQYKRWEFGSAPRPYGWKDLPREILGEGVVLRASENGSTVLLTESRKEIYLGDYVELKQEVPEPPPPPPPPLPPANRAPTVTVTADRTSVLAGERVRVTARASDPDGDPLSYGWRASGGQVIGSGSIVEWDSSGLTPGRYTVTASVDDSKGGAADGSVALNVELPPPTPAEPTKIAEGYFRAESARVDNVLKRILDDAALRLQGDPRARLLIVGYADPEEENPEQLAAQRAESAKAYLVSRGIDAGRIDTRAATGQPGGGRQNRRIDLIWVPQGPAD